MLAIAAINLRGIRESGLDFSIPLYGYRAAMFGVLAIGMVRFTTGTMPVYRRPHTVVVNVPYRRDDQESILTEPLPKP